MLDMKHSSYLQNYRIDMQTAKICLRWSMEKEQSRVSIRKTFAQFRNFVKIKLVWRCVFLRIQFWKNLVLECLPIIGHFCIIDRWQSRRVQITRAQTLFISVEGGQQYRFGTSILQCWKVLYQNPLQIVQ